MSKKFVKKEKFDLYDEKEESDEDFEEDFFAGNKESEYDSEDSNREGFHEDLVEAFFPETASGSRSGSGNASENGSESENEESDAKYSDSSQEENPLESTRLDENPLPKFQDLEISAILEIPQNLDEQGLTLEALQHIQNPDEYYDYSAVNLILETTAPQNVKVIPIEGGDRKIYLERAFREFRKSNLQEAIIPIHNQNHFVGIYVKYNEEQERYEVLYFDPFGIESIAEIPEDIRDLLKTEFGIEKVDIKFSKTAIQSQNVHCGPFTIFLLRAIANGDIEVQDQEIFAKNQQGYFVKIDNLNAESSDEFGIFLRQQDYKIATAQTEQDLGKIELEKLLTINYHQQFPTILESSFNSSHNESSYSLGRVSGRNNSGDVSSMVVEFDETGYSTTTRKSRKNSGFDENFKKEEQEKGNWARIDGQLGLTSEDLRFSEEAFKYSRLPTNSYIHFRGKNNETTGHSGGFLKPLEKLAQIKKQSKLKKLFQEAAGNHEKRREAANQVPTLLKSTTGGNAIGSNGSNGFHAQRQKAIEKVIEEYKKKKKEEKKQAVKAATVEALKFVVNSTVGFRDNTQANAYKFKGITIDGLDLSDPESRKFALKYYQAQRDLWKLGILKYQNRLNEVDSEDEDYEQQENEEVARINRKLSRTALEEKYHGHHQAKRELSPLRAESPYSTNNVGNFIAKFQQATTYTDISTICATPVPAIRPKPETQETPHYTQPTESSQAKTKPKIKLKPIKPQKTSETQEEFVSGIASNPASIPTSTPKKIAFKKVEKPASQDQEK